MPHITINRRTAVAVVLPVLAGLTLSACGSS